MVSRCELRLEQYRLHCLLGGRDDAAALNELARLERPAVWLAHGSVELDEPALSQFVLCPSIALKKIRNGAPYVVRAGAQIIAFPVRVSKGAHSARLGLLRGQVTVLRT